MVNHPHGGGERGGKQPGQHQAERPGIGRPFEDVVADQEQDEHDP